MAVKIRLKRMGSKKRPFYRIIATDSRNPRDGRFIETLGYYNPMTDPADLSIKEDLVFKWMERGAQPTENADHILRKVGVMKKWSLLKKGVSREDLDSKYEELKSNETQPMSAEEREKKIAEKSAAVAAEEAKAAEEAEAVEAAETTKEAKSEVPEAAAETPADLARDASDASDEKDVDSTEESSGGASEKEGEDAGKKE